jgi:hypothetical protein
VAARSGGTNLVVTQTGNVGVGTTPPGQRLEVAGRVYSNTGGFRFPHNTVQTTASVASGNAVLNQTTLLSGANFNINGTATVGGTLTAATAAVTGYATVSGTLTTTNAVVSSALTGNGASISGVGIRADGDLNLRQNTASKNILVGFSAGRRMEAGYSSGALVRLMPFISLMRPYCSKRMPIVATCCAVAPTNCVRSELSSSSLSTSPLAWMACVSRASAFTA